MGIDPRPVFEYDQVLTLHDLVSLRNGYVYQYEKTSWWQSKKRYQCYIAIGLLDSLIHWIHNHKLIKQGDNDEPDKAI